MTGKLLDVSRLPTQRTYVCADGSNITLREYLEVHRPVIEALSTAMLVKENDSFGFAMMVPMIDPGPFGSTVWDDPERMIWFVGGWGPNRDRYIANAVRKLRPLARTGCESTLEMRFRAPGLFEEKVESRNEDGEFPWGDFPWGGAVEVRFGDLSLFGAVSCLSEMEDDFVTRLILGGLGQFIVAGDKMLPDG